tara:strand:+ start:572 stop:745 length:174 start_codon:yes stop_codon:yes gene_type:complete
MPTKKGFKWDGKTRISTELYRKNFDEIFKKKKQQADIQSDNIEMSQLEKENKQNVKK